MKITKPEPVTRIYCDECGRECFKVGNVICGVGNKEYCGECHEKLYPFRKSMAIRNIKDQPFYTAKKT